MAARVLRDTAEAALTSPESAAVAGAKGISQRAIRIHFPERGFGERPDIGVIIRTENRSTMNVRPPDGLLQISCLLLFLRPAGAGHPVVGSGSC